MRKILIISYYHPPAHYANALRSRYWSDYLYDFGFYPIVITRQWPEAPLDWQNQYKYNNPETKIIKNQRSEIHYLAYKPNFLDRWHSLKLTRSKYAGLGQIAAGIKKMVEHYGFCYESIPGLKKYCKKIVTTQKPDLILINSQPFNLFKYGAYFYKKYKIPWVANYQDDWTTNTLRNTHPFYRILKPAETRIEQKTLRSALIFSTVSKELSHKISRLVEKKGIVHKLGIPPMDLTASSRPRADEIHIAYVGTIYRNQDFSPILRAIVSANQSGLKVILHLVGSKIVHQEEKEIISRNKSYFQTTPWLATAALNAYLADMDAFLLVAYGDGKGIVTAKVFEYLAHRKPIILYPDDESELNRILTECGLGLICNTPDDLRDVLPKLKTKPIVINDTKYEQYSAKNQVKKFSHDLIKILNTL